MWRDCALWVAGSGQSPERRYVAFMKRTMLSRVVCREKARWSGRRSVFGPLVAIAVMTAAIDPLPAQSVWSSSDGATAIRQFIDSPQLAAIDGQRIEASALRRFYADRDFRPIWSGSDRAERQSTLVQAALSNAAADGLDPADYHAGGLTANARDVSAMAAHDILMTDGLLRYAHDMRVGRVAPAQRGANVDLPVTTYDAARALTDALATDRLAGFIADLAPPQPEYARLKAALARYRDIAAREGWPRLPAGPEIMLGSNDPRLAALRARLAAEEPIPANAGPLDLEVAVRRYQARNGLEPDGRVGPRTQAMLNVPASERVEQIVVNMERWRWLPRNMGARYIEVNVAGADLRAVADGATILTSRVIIGDRRHQSPMLRTVAVAVTVNPPWNVPPSIARNEILPKLRRDRSYLAAQHMILLNGPPGDPHGLGIDWRRVSAAAFPFRVQQLPGPENALGLLKIEMPNRFDVYLHDTPARSLFARSDRALSHGCIRVQEIGSLASFALTGDPGGKLHDLDAAIAAETTEHLAIKSPLPVYLLYWTAVTNEDGSFGFRPDVYGRDRPLIERLRSAPGGAGALAATTRACPGNTSNG